MTELTSAEQGQLHELLGLLCENAGSGPKPIVRLGHFAHACVYVVSTGEEGFPVPDDPEDPFVESAIAYDQIVWTAVEAMTDDPLRRTRLVAGLLELISSAMIVAVDAARSDTVFN
jgi:hypothetical protein